MERLLSVDPRPAKLQRNRTWRSLLPPVTTVILTSIGARVGTGIIHRCSKT
jgi:hypothetical protein